MKSRDDSLPSSSSVAVTVAFCPCDSFFPTPASFARRSPVTAPDRRIFAMSAAEPVSGATSWPRSAVGAGVESIDGGVAFVAAVGVCETEAAVCVAFAGLEDVAAASGASAGADRRRMT